MIAREAEIHGIDLRLCGEMAGDPMCVAILIGLGYRHLSMNGRSVARVKYLLRRIDFAEAENLAQRSLEAQLATEVRHQVAAFMERRGMGGLIRGGYSADHIHIFNGIRQPAGSPCAIIRTFGAPETCGAHFNRCSLSAK